MKIADEIEAQEAKIEKVRKLAEKGFQGEKEVAKRKLKELEEKLAEFKKKHKWTDKDKLIDCEFFVKDFEDSMYICHQCILKVVPKAVVARSMYGAKRIYAKMTKEQCEKVNKYYAFYWDLYLKEKRKFIQDFIINYNIGAFQMTQK